MMNGMFCGFIVYQITKKENETILKVEVFSYCLRGKFVIIGYGNLYNK